MNYDRIKKLRENTGMSARKFAEAINMKYTTYYGYENGVSEPNSAVLVKLCDYFGCTADYLLGLANEPSQHYEDEKKSPAPAEAEAGEIAKRITDLLVECGYIRAGEDISDRDAAFLTNWIGIFNAWFQKDKES